MAYGEGKGVPQDYAEAVKWDRKAADQGHAEAQYNLSVAYEKGEGVPKNYVSAHVWLNLFSISDHPHAQGVMVKLQQLEVVFMTPEEIDQARELAVEWHNEKYLEE